MKSFKYMLGRRIKMYSIDRVLSLVIVKWYGILSKPASSESRPNLKIYRHNGSVGMYNQCIPWCICAFIDLTTKAPPETSTEMPTFMPLSEAGVPLLQQSPQDPAIPVQLSFDPVTALAACLVKWILDFDFVEMSDMLPDAWQEDSIPASDPLSSSR